MHFFEWYAKVTHLKLLDTPELVLSEFEQICEDLAHIDRDLAQEVNRHDSEYLWRLRQLKFSASRRWTALELLGLRIPIRFVEQELRSILQNPERKQLPLWHQLATVALSFLVWLELHPEEMDVDPDPFPLIPQKDILMFLIAQLYDKHEIPREIFSPLEPIGDKNPKFCEEFIAAISQSLFGVTLKLKRSLAH